MRTNCPSKGYTIVEAMVAISLLMLGVAAAAALSMTLVRQEEINARAARAVNWQENAVRLYQLGIGTTGADLIGILPVVPQAHTLTVQVSTETITNFPTGTPAPEVANVTLSFGSDPESGQTRASVMKAVR